MVLKDVEGQVLSTVLAGLLRHSRASAAFRRLLSRELLAVAGESARHRVPEQRMQAWISALELVRRIEWFNNHIFHTAFSPDSGLYLGGGDTGTVRIWEVATGNQLLELTVTVAWFAPDGRKLLGSKGDKVLSVFDLDTGQEEPQLGGRPTPFRQRVPLARRQECRHRPPGQVDTHLGLRDR